MIYHPRLLIILAALTVSGCGLAKIGGDKSNLDPPAKLKSIETFADIKKLWSERAGKGYGDEYIKLVPAYNQGMIFVVDRHGDLRSFNADTGRSIWRSKLNAEITGGPGVNDSFVILGSQEGEVLMYTNEDGQLIWQSKVSSEILAAPQEHDGIVVVRTIDGKIFGLDASDGNHLWVYERTVPSLTLRGTSPPVIAGNRVIAGFDSGHLSAVDLYTGKLIWETSISLSSGSSQLERIVDIDSEPVVKDSNIYVVTFQGNLAAVTLESGRILWGQEISSYSGLSVDDEAIYITDDQSHVWALERTTGVPLWQQKELHARSVTRPAVLGDLVVVGDFEGYLHWLNKSTGEFMARTKVSGAAIQAPPVAILDIVYIYSSNGALSAYTYY